jgi:hypothetical protein
MKKTIKQIIEESKEYYRTHPRSKDKKGSDNLYSCFYNLIVDNKIVSHCVVGRCLLKKYQILDLKGNDCDNYTLVVDNKAGCLDNMLKPEYRGHSEDFWDMLQELHDTNDYWEPSKVEGEYQLINKKGEERIKVILTHYPENKDNKTNQKYFDLNDL